MSLLVQTPDFTHYQGHSVTNILLEILSHYLSYTEIVAISFVDNKTYRWKTAQELHQQISNDKKTTDSLYLYVLTRPLPDNNPLYKALMHMLIQVICNWDIYQNIIPSCVRAAFNDLNQFAKGHRRILQDLNDKNASAISLDAAWLRKSLTTFIANNKTSRGISKNPNGLKLYAILFDYLIGETELVTRNRNTKITTNVMPDSFDTSNARKLPTGFQYKAGLTEHSVKLLVNYCLSSQDQVDDISGIYVLGLLVGGIGIPKEFINQPDKPLSLFDYRDGLLYVSYQLHIAKSNQAPTAQQFSNEQFQLPVPFMLPATFRLGKIPTYKMLQEFIRAFNKRNQLSVFITQITDYQSNFLKKIGVDNALITLLSGSSPKKHSGIYYTTLELIDLHQQRSPYFGHLSELTGLKFLNAVIPHDVKIGSMQCLPNESIQLLFKILRKHGEKFDLPFNNFVLYTLCMLFLSTGHRPVNQPFESRDFFDNKLAWCTILDKGDDSKRVIPLPKIAQEQLGYYLQKLQNRAKLPTINNSEQERAIAALTSKKALFYWIDGKGGIEEVSVSSVQQKMRHFVQCYLSTIHRREDEEHHFLALFNHANSNWQRHQLRTYLSRLISTGQLNAAAVDHFVGHHQNVSSLCDGLGDTELIKITNIINSWMTTLAIKPRSS